MKMQWNGRINLYWKRERKDTGEDDIEKNY
jgi:hypothetical protein